MAGLFMTIAIKDASSVMVWPLKIRSTLVEDKGKTALDSYYISVCPDCYKHIQWMHSYGRKGFAERSNKL